MAQETLKQAAVFLFCREKDMDHAIRIPEMGVSKVPVLTLNLNNFDSGSLRVGIK